MFVYLHVTLFVPPSYDIIMPWNSAGPPQQMPQIEWHYNVPAFICSYPICSLWSYNAIASQAALHYNVCFSFLSFYNWMFSSSPLNDIIMSWHCSIHKYCEWHKVITCQCSYPVTHFSGVITPSGCRPCYNVYYSLSQVIILGWSPLNYIIMLWNSVIPQIPQMIWRYNVPAFISLLLFCSFKVL